MATYDLPTLLQSAPGFFAEDAATRYAQEQYYPNGIPSWVRFLDPTTRTELMGGGDSGQWEETFTDPVARGWRIGESLTDVNPEFGNSNNLMLEGIGPNGEYIVRRKTGDREGTRFAYIPQSDGTFKLSDPLGTVGWNTNENIFDDPIALAMMLGVGGIGLGAAGAFSGLGMPGASQGGGLIGGNAAGLGGMDAVAAAEWFGGAGAATNPGALFGSAVPGAASAAPGALNMAEWWTGAAEPTTFMGGAPMATTPIPGIATAGTAGMGGIGLPDVASAAITAAGQSGGGGTGGTQGGGGTGGFQLPSDLAGWAKLLGPLIGGGLLAYEASQQNGQQNPQDEFTRDWARGNLTKGWAPLPTNVTGQYRDAATSGLMGGNPAIPGLLQKRYY